MKKWIGSLLGVFVAIGIHAQESAQIAIQVTVLGKASPNGVEVIKEGDLNSIDMKLLKDAIYSVEVPDPFGTKEKVPLSVPYVVTANWPNQSEKLYLELRAGSLKAIDAQVWSVESAGSAADLKAIQALNRENKRDQLHRYFLARSLHQYWRTQEKNIKHQHAVQSLREWFEASQWLSTRTGSYFGMDPEARKYVREYEELAEQDASFRKTLKLYFQGPTLTRMRNELATGQYRLVGTVANAVKQGDLTLANSVNTTLLSDLEQSTPAEQAVVRKTWGVTVESLRANATFIESRAEALNVNLARD